MLRANVRGRITSRIFLLITICSLLSAALTFVSPSVAHAAPLCGYGPQQGGKGVYDSYGHLEGTIFVYFSSCDNATTGVFSSNYNTWKSVDVYIEYAYVPGYLHKSYSYISNNMLSSPAYTKANTCYYAGVYLYDNRGERIWVQTANVMPSENSGTLC